MQTVYKIDSERMYERIMTLADIGKTVQDGVKRVALSKEDKEAQILVTKWMEQAGMTVSHDHFGNLIGRKEGISSSSSLPSIVIGSHIDSVRNGGRFDGIIGVIAGIEIVQVIHDAELSHEHPLEVVAFCEEEGSRFNDGLFGSRGMVGRIDQSHLKLKDENGVTRYEALQSFGFDIDPDRIAESVRTAKDIKLYLEMHIEQGPYLDSNDYPVGIVKGIAGPSWYNIKLEGEAGHAGTVPMSLRKDPVAGAAEIISEVERLCTQDPNAETVGTVGRVKVLPGGSNVIPSSVEFSLDLRDIDLTRRNRIYQQILDKIQNVSFSRNLSFNVEKYMAIDPVYCSDEIIQLFNEISEEKEMNAPIMISGAGHDAMLLAEITDVGMIFVRCAKGISHQPNEHAEKADIALGTELLLEAVLRSM
ncbi:Zn-dependent hydrolase [Neobacillus sp. PS2-9]|uniref:Zn-dependent hydrolase n=1 Tax=Neobacillus sp. PS2-9 TaxID=3070676 RepID=UPI0027E029F6|nr:Zn-dependent hydrolase [Neobacillus sp. PS2-9]WML58909.1 Zn-dependent hydrolase [Neobacillus sp. PS2-9]